MEQRTRTKKKTHWCSFLILLVLLPFLVLPAAAGAAGTVKTRAAAGDSSFQMDEVVVTATRVDDTIKDIPKNVTVITSEDIALAPSNNIVDLLSREADLNLRSPFGHDGRAGIDIRGMGDAFVSNVVVMVDGYRLNASDMSGANLSSIPLGRVERIEIVRGGGSVIYGNGAVGGVVNIITRQGPPDHPEAGVYTSYGSWDTFDSRVSGRGAAGNVWVNVDASYYDADGYRDNGYFRKKDARLDLGWQKIQWLTLRGKMALHEDQLGFPGPVAAPAADSRGERKKTRAPDDYSRTTDNRYHLAFTIDKNWGVIDGKFGYRDRDNPYILGYSPIINKDDQTNEITEDTWQANLTYRLSRQFGGRENRLLAGFDYYDTDYQREDRGAEKKNGKTKTSEWFVHDQLRLPGRLQLSCGYRESLFKGNFHDDHYRDFYTDPVYPPPVFIPPRYLYSAWVRGEDNKKTWHNNAYELGLSWQATDDWTLFASYSKSYRIPNVDELALAADDLHPQQGFHWNVGGRYRWGSLAEMTLTCFQMRIEDEIYYGEDPITRERLNRNYDEKTRRRGVETQVKMYPTDWLCLWGNYSWMHAKFEKSKTYVPLVPKYKATLGAECYPLPELTFSLAATYVGSRYDGNDQDNNLYDKLDSYLTMDCKLIWQWDRYRLFAGINNIFDELYSTSSYSDFQYPMPTRSFYGGLEVTF